MMLLFPFLISRFSSSRLCANIDGIDAIEMIVCSPFVYQYRRSPCLLLQLPVLFLAG